MPSIVNNNTKEFTWGKKYPNIHTTQGACGVVFGDGPVLCIVL